MTPYDDEKDSANYVRLRDHVTGELKALRALMEKAVEQVHLAQLGATSQNEKIARVAAQVENIERTVVRGNGTHSLLTRVALMEGQINENKKRYEEFSKAKLQYKMAISVALISLLGTIGTIVSTFFIP